MEIKVYSKDELNINDSMKKLKDELAESQKKSSNNNDNSNKENSKLSKINKLAELRCKL